MHARHVSVQLKHAAAALLLDNYIIGAPNCGILTLAVYIKTFNWLHHTRGGIYQNIQLAALHM